MRFHFGSLKKTLNSLKMNTIHYLSRRTRWQLDWISIDHMQLNFIDSRGIFFSLERTPAHLEVNIKCFFISKKIVFIYTECWTITEFPTALVNIVNLLSWSRVFRSMTWPHRSCARHLRSRREASQIASPWWWEATALSMKKSGWLRLMAPRACSLSARTDW